MIWIGIAFLVILIIAARIFQNKIISHNSVVSRQAIDHKHYLYVIKWEKKQYLIIIGPNSFNIIDSRDLDAE